MSGTLHPLYGALPWRSNDGSAIVSDGNGKDVAVVAFRQSREAEVAIAKLLAAAPELAEALLEIDAIAVRHEAGAIGKVQKIARAALKAVGAE